MNSFQGNLLFLTLCYIIALVAPIGLNNVLSRFDVQVESDLLQGIMFWGVRFATLLMSKRYLMKKDVAYTAVQIRSFPFQWRRFGFILLCILAGVPLIGLISTMFGQDPMNIDAYAAFIGHGMSSQWHSKTNMFLLLPAANALFYQFFMFRDVSFFAGPILGGILTSFVAGVMDMNHYREVFTYNAISCVIYHFLDYHPLALAFLIVLSSGLSYLNVYMYDCFHVSLLSDAIASRSRRAIILENLMSYGENNNFLRGVFKATSKIPSNIRDNYLDHIKAEFAWAVTAYHYMNVMMHEVGHSTNVF